MNKMSENMNSLLESLGRLFERVNNNEEEASIHFRRAQIPLIGTGFEYLTRKYVDDKSI